MSPVWESIAGGVGFVDALRSLVEVGAAKRDRRERIQAKKAIGQLMVYREGHGLTYAAAEAQWNRYFGRSNDLLGEFERAATEEEFTGLFRRAGFIDGQPSREQQAVIAALIRFELDRSDPGFRLIDERLDQLANLLKARESTPPAALPTSQKVRIFIKGWQTQTPTFGFNASDYDLVFDWSQYFQRESRTISGPHTWDTEILPAFTQAVSRVAHQKNTNEIHIGGFAPLSIGLAVGVALPISQWRVSVQQKDDIWSLAVPSADHGMTPCKVTADIENPLDFTKNPFPTDEKPSGIIEPLSSNGTGLCVEVSPLDRIIRKEVDAYRQTLTTDFAARLTLMPAETRKLDLTPSHGRAYVESTYALLSKAATQYSEFHLFQAAPLGFSVLLGHKMNCLGVIQTYELQHEHGYTPSCQLIIR